MKVKARPVSPFPKQSIEPHWHVTPQASGIKGQGGALTKKKEVVGGGFAAQGWSED